jgi:hypothetical protein
VTGCISYTESGGATSSPIALIALIIFVLSFFDTFLPPRACDNKAGARAKTVTHRQLHTSLGTFLSQALGKGQRILHHLVSFSLEVQAK